MYAIEKIEEAKHDPRLSTNSFVKRKTTRSFVAPSFSGLVFRKDTSNRRFTILAKQMKELQQQDPVSDVINKNSSSSETSKSSDSPQEQEAQKNIMLTKIIEASKEEEKPELSSMSEVDVNGIEVRIRNLLNPDQNDNDSLISDITEIQVQRSSVGNQFA